ncbi:MAG: putative metal-dependent phosphoesterase TrpH, contains domain [Frankiales bacterium]|nr:putative metal-dependent phosphoesterase TrpH, contains domain [Frankiales bacterium]
MRLNRPLALAVSAAVAVALALPLSQTSAAGVVSDLYGADKQTGQHIPPLGGLGRTYVPYVGSLHEHSGYSDGWDGSTPATYFASGEHFGLDFMGGSDHSDFLSAPISTSQYCFPDPTNPQNVDPVALAAELPNCPLADPDPVKSLTKWDATKKYAVAATTPTYGAFQGFEWTSDVYGHISAYFSKNFANAKLDGYPTPKTFYDWLSRRPELGGGSDALAVFNHPGAKDQLKPARNAVGLADSTSLNWNDFAYDARVDNQFVGVETYNDKDEYGTTRDASKYPEGYYAHVLDKGWHVAPIGAEDLGHRRADDWGGPSWAKTVVLATDRSPAALKAAMLARRIYSVRNKDIRIDLHVAGEMMGTRLTVPTGSALPIDATATWPGHPGLTLQLVTSHGVVVASGTDSLSTSRVSSGSEKYYFLRVKDGTSYVAYSAPVWISAAKGGHVGEWLAGDFHVHTCYGHDSYCPRGQNGKYFQEGVGVDTPVDGQLAQAGQTLGPALDGFGLGDSNTDLSEGYTFGGTVEERFAEASLKGLDFLAITDHHSDSNPEDDGSKSVNDAGFGTHEVIGVPGYENSIKGHAQMLGATHVYPAGDQSATAINAMGDALRADGGLLQANHPTDGMTRVLNDCRNLSGMHWQYGYDVRVDTVEVWNTGHLLQPPFPASMSNDDSVRYWECLLNRGWHVAATGGSDSHWMSISSFQGLGNPTTWVFAPERSARGVLQGVREGRTSISLAAPVTGSSTQLILEADVDRDGVYESMMGDTVPGGTPMQVRAIGLASAGLVQIRYNSIDIVQMHLLPGGANKFLSPAGAGWIRASLFLPDARAQRATYCDKTLDGMLHKAGESTTYCRNELLSLAMTSPIYLTKP